LDLHAALAEVMHFSAAGEAIDRFLRDLEDTEVLAADGSSAELLHAALSQLVAVSRIEVHVLHVKVSAQKKCSNIVVVQRSSTADQRVLSTKC
jgi:hypothetical protein